MIPILRILLFALAISTPALAETTVLPVEENLADVAETWPVITSMREASTLRVAFHKLGPWPVTDVSPDHDVMLSVFVLFPEHATASATWHIAGVLDMVKPTRVQAGIYDLRIRTYDLHRTDCYMVDQTLRVDARVATIEGRNATPEFFNDVTLTSPVTVTTLQSDCAPNNGARLK